MKHYVETLSIWKLMQRIDKINLCPQYIGDRKNWSIKTYRSFVEGILLGYDSPKLYFALRSTYNYDMDVIDGVQRIKAISKFINDEFCVNLAIINPDLKDVSFRELSNTSELIESFWSYPLTLVEYDSDDVSFFKSLRQFISQRPAYLEADNYASRKSINLGSAADLNIMEIEEIISGYLEPTPCEKKNLFSYAFMIEHEMNEQYHNEQD